MATPLLLVESVPESWESNYLEGVEALVGAHPATSACLVMPGDQDVLSFIKPLPYRSARTEVSLQKCSVQSVHLSPKLLRHIATFLILGCGCEVIIFPGGDGAGESVSVHKPNFSDHHHNDNRGYRLYDKHCLSNRTIPFWNSLLINDGHRSPVRSGLNLTGPVLKGWYLNSGNM